jgi:Ser/Thr protein kinase RdoA (MazF antagonist)
MSTPPCSNLVQTLLEESAMASSHEPVDVTLVSTLLEKHYRVSGELERLATEKDDTFRLRSDSGSYLVKVSPPDEPAAVVALQTATMRFLEHAAPELPVQRVRLSLHGDDNVVIATDEGRPRVLRVFDFVDGAVLAHTSPDAEQLAKVGQMLGRVDVALAAYEHPADRRRLVWDIRHFHQLTELVDHTPDVEHRKVAREVFRLVDAVIVPKLSGLETQVIHGDYSPHNVVVDPHRDDFVSGVIDFGDTMRSAVIFDPAVCMANLLGSTPAHPWLDACAFAAGYLRTRPIKEAEVPLLPIAALARLTLRALITHWRADLVPERRDYLSDHAQDDWINVQRAMEIPLGDVVSQLRESCPNRV